MNNKKLSFVISLLLTAGLSLQVNAQEDMSDQEKFELADFDGNGCVSWEELRNRGTIVFDALDLNKDGAIAGDEHPRTVDKNGNVVHPESVDIAHYQVALRQAFDASDSDESGCLEADEWH